MFPCDAFESHAAVCSGRCAFVAKNGLCYCLSFIFCLFVFCCFVGVNPKPMVCLPFKSDIRLHQFTCVTRTQTSAHHVNYSMPTHGEQFLKCFGLRQQPSKRHTYQDWANKVASHCVTCARIYSVEPNTRQRSWQWRYLNVMSETLCLFLFGINNGQLDCRCRHRNIQRRNIMSVENNCTQFGCSMRATQLHHCWSKPIFAYTTTAAHSLKCSLGS